MNQLTNQNLKVTLLDGYVDEPSCLGVPPYVSPYIRYTYGALLKSSVKENNIEYLTIDELRAKEQTFMEYLSDRDLVITIAGTTVPGRYLGGKPISYKEINKLAEQLSEHKVPFFLGGPVVLCNMDFSNINYLLDETGAVKLYHYLSTENLRIENLRTDRGFRKNKNLELIEDFAVLGARVVLKHPDYPNVIAELETYRGCLRNINCAFCSESQKKVLYTRSPEHIGREVDSLYKNNIINFRLGAQTDLFMYGAVNGGDGFVPNPDYIERLYYTIREKAPDLHVLHMDNVSPATIAKHPEQSVKIMETIVKYNTPGDTAAFGLESADEQVLKRNKIGTGPNETLQAIRLMNEIGGDRVEGLPQLLPGINFLYGLSGQSSETYDKNFQFLKTVLEKEYLLRRINLRQVIAHDTYNSVKVNSNKFKQHKELVNQEINQPMLEKVFPKGTILRNVFMEQVEGNVTFGRQFGSYPVLVGVPGKHAVDRFFDLKVIEHGYRSITALLYPFDINQATLEELRALPGIGKKRAARLFVEQPIKGPEELADILGESVDIKPINKCIDYYSSR